MRSYVYEEAALSVAPVRLSVRPCLRFTQSQRHQIALDTSN